MQKVIQKLQRSVSQFREKGINIMEKIKNLWLGFAEKHPGASKWIREGGLFVIVSNLITVLKYFMLLFLPLAFAGLPKVDFGFPGIDITLFGETFKWNIIGYDAAHGGLPYFCAYMIAMVVGECINFPIQRSFVFRSKHLVSGNVVSDCILYRNLYRKLYQLYLGCCCRNVCTGLALQHRNNRIKWWCIHGGILLC